MELSKNSVWAKMYRWFYVEKTMPETICVYFWKLVLAVLLAPLLFLFTLPTTIIKFLFINFIIEFSYFNTFTEKLINNFILWILLFIIFTVIFAIITMPIYGIFDPNTILHHLQFTGAILLGVIGLVLLSWFIVFIGASLEKIKIVKIENKKTKVNLLKEFIKSKYNKYCTKINWK